MLGRDSRMNRSARESGATPATVARALGLQLADPEGLVAHLQQEALRTGHADDRVIGRRDSWRLSAHRVDDHTILWRIERGLGSLGEGILPMLSIDARAASRRERRSSGDLVGTLPCAGRRALVTGPAASSSVRVHRIRHSLTSVQPRTPGSVA
jgi:hypothetical protein